ncbi:MAG TPA: thioredoxin domain-containing protein [Stellaceae bacterium]|nr:thioredoxin domain-containing protein [Stellaceae bacterium]
MSANALAQETSPYLLQHKDNPVHWQPWGPAALAQARAENKPILLSVGYAACHWCHVMAHESFEDPAIAARMNADFVNIKVDREERPDLDTIYQHALQVLGEQGGWPLTMFLTPAGEPFWGGTYFPPSSRWGRPGFPEVLSAIAAAYRDKRDEIASNVGAIKGALARLAQPQAGAGIALDLIDRAAARLVQEIDMVEGGIGSAPKFPQVPILALLWRAWKRRRSEVMRQAVLVTLDHICQGGIYDHLGGGFARYSVDAHWLAPHFEKMLYDNALLIELLTEVWQETKSPLYAQRVAETIQWIEREMRVAGGFASSLDADSEHEEGKFYVWDAAEIDHLLGERAARFKEFYDVAPGGNWEGHTILNRLGHLALADDASEAMLGECRAVLLRAREPRVRPSRDDKVLADWNGLIIAALAAAGAAFARADWSARAREGFAFIVDNLSEPDGRLAHAWRAGQRRHRAVLDDYANMSRAALALYEATGEAEYLERARAWVGICDRHYWDAAGGGYFFTADDAEALIIRTKQAVDQPNPSGNGSLAQVLARLHYLTGEERYRSRANGTLAAFAGELQRNLFGLATLLNAAELLERAVQIVVIGEQGEPGTAALLGAIAGVSLPGKILMLLAPGAALPQSHPAAGKSMVGGRATAYVCQGPVCSLPLTDPAALAADLAAH